MTIPAEPLPVARIDQVALVVRDLEATLRAYWERHRIGPWAIRTFDRTTVRALTYRGQPADYAMRVAFARCGEVQLELIQSLRGPNIYEEFLDRHGAGLHHVGIFVPELAAAVAAMSRRGMAVIQGGTGTGLDGDGGFAYFDLTTPLATIVEFIELPRTRIPPEATYPPS
jgi:4-hydroxyphenylpyruvate dioxygenase-like putative hemolysin